MELHLNEVHRENYVPHLEYYLREDVFFWISRCRVKISDMVTYCRFLRVVVHFNFKHTRYGVNWEPLHKVYRKSDERKMRLLGCNSRPGIAAIRSSDCTHHLL